MKNKSLDKIKNELLRSIDDLSKRGLSIGSKWSCEQLNGLDNQISSIQNKEKEDDEQQVNIEIEIKCKLHENYDCIAYCVDCKVEICQCCLISHSRHEFKDLSDIPTTTTTAVIDSNIIYGSEEHSKYLLAKSYFDLKEYRRCADILENPLCKSSLSLFLKWYSLYLAYEKRHNEELIENKDTSSSNNKDKDKDSNSNNQNPNDDKSKSTTAANVNNNFAFSSETAREMQQLSNKIEQWYRETTDSNNIHDPFLLYLYAVLLKKRNNISLAKQILVDSVTLYPCNWSAWIDLASLCNGIQSVSQLKLPDHFMKDFFFAHITLELQQNKESLSIYNSISKTFPNSNYILAQNAIGHYNMRAYDVAEELFEKLLEVEPHRLENIDVYSNILYVHNNKANLSILAHKAMTTEKYSPETCCIIGNYYSLKSEHDKAILYFQRALKLNDKYLAAWTLIGHEFLEIKNVGAAINAYRKAVDINSKDYRAWYGLGQTYQLLKLPLYSLYYFQKATAIYPYDPRMWCAIAGCYEILERIPDAIRCYERAEENFDRERVALSKLAKLYQDMQRNEEAAYYYKKNLYHRDNEKIDGQETIDALHFLAHYHKNLSQFDQAEKYCLRLLDYAGPEKEEAKALLKDIRVGYQQK